MGVLEKAVEENHFGKQTNLIWNWKISIQWIWKKFFTEQRKGAAGRKAGINST